MQQNAILRTMKVYTIQGNRYECGVQTGKVMKSGIAYRLDLFGITDRYVRKNAVRIKKLEARYSKKYPLHFEELRGIADGAGQGFAKLFMLNCAELWPEAHGCTSIAVNSPGNILLAHNEDG